MSMFVISKYNDDNESETYLELIYDIDSIVKYDFHVHMNHSNLCWRKVHYSSTLICTKILSMCTRENINDDIGIKATIKQSIVIMNVMKIDKRLLMCCNMHECESKVDLKWVLKSNLIYFLWKNKLWRGFLSHNKNNLIKTVKLALPWNRECMWKKWNLFFVDIFVFSLHPTKISLLNMS